MYLFDSLDYDLPAFPRPFLTPWGWEDPDSPSLDVIKRLLSFSFNYTSQILGTPWLTVRDVI